MSKNQKKVYFETYGCQMNLADAEIIKALLRPEGYSITEDLSAADVVLVNTCGVREHAEQRIYGRLGELKSLKNKRPDVIVGLLGCLAERFRRNLTGGKAGGVCEIIDVIAGPDEYRKLPRLISDARPGVRGIAVQLSRTETYDDISPLRTGGVSAWVTVTRGCDKFCSFCVVPFTRGRERSRPLQNIVHEVRSLSEQGFKEVTLLGQNVNSYADKDHDFTDLLSAVARIDPSLRVRFITSHPHDMAVSLIEAVAGHKNICKYLHLPVQSGSDRILRLMNRGYDRAHYLRLIRKIRDLIPDVSLSTDVITGFPTETEEDHEETLGILSEIGCDSAFMFKYSPRENTAAYIMNDDVPDETKTRRIKEIIELQNGISATKNNMIVGQTVETLVEGESKKSPDEWTGRTDGNKTVIFRKGRSKIGDYVNVKINRANSATLFGTLFSEITAEAAV